MSTNDELPREVARRILELKHSAESDAEFARRLGLSPQVISNYRAGRHGASLEALATAVQRGGGNLQWLLTGEGPRDAALESVVSDDGVLLEALATRMQDCLQSCLDELRSELGLERSREGVP